MKDNHEKQTLVEADSVAQRVPLEHALPTCERTKLRFEHLSLFYLTYIKNDYKLYQK